MAVALGMAEPEDRHEREILLQRESGQGGEVLALHEGRPAARFHIVQQAAPSAPRSRASAMRPTKGGPGPPPSV